jgi:hypothetical protein
MNLTREERIERHKKFLDANWALVAGFSWEHFQKQGRGAVVIDENDFVHANTPQYAPVKLRYVADGSPVLDEIGGWTGEFYCPGIAGRISDSDLVSPGQDRRQEELEGRVPAVTLLYEFSVRFQPPVGNKPHRMVCRCNHTPQAAQPLAHSPR